MISKYHFDSEKRLRSDVYDDIYFSTSGAENESEHVFIDGNNLKERFKCCDYFTIGEAGFGTGLNFLKTVAEWKKSFTTDKHLTYIGFESTPLSPETLEIAHSEWSSLCDISRLLLTRYSATPQASCDFVIKELNITLKLFIGEINKEIKNITETVDAWFLDGFSPAKNPAMWSDELFRNMILHGKKHQTTFATYSCARAVRDGLTNSGFTVEKVAGFGKKRFMLTGKY